MYEEDGDKEWGYDARREERGGGKDNRAMFERRWTSIHRAEGHSGDGTKRQEKEKRRTVIYEAPAATAVLHINVVIWTLEQEGQGAYSVESETH